MKRVIIVHCWDGAIEDGWYPWLKNHLQENNISVIMENMPNPETPEIEKWVSKLGDLIDDLDEDTYFIGHSIGCQTILRYLDTVNGPVRIGGILFIAPWLNLLPAALVDGADKIAKPWVEMPINFDKIKHFTSNTTCIFSDDDYFVPLDQEKEFKSKLGANTVIIHGKGHISGDDGITELPIIWRKTVEMVGIKPSSI